MVTVDVRANAPTVPLGTPGAPRFAALDAFRAVGALMVVATHVAFVTGRTQGGPFSGLLGRLDVGVAVFFVLSGFLLFRPYVAARASSGPAVSTPRYLIRRAPRILPAYWLLVVASLLGLQSNRDATALDWARHLTLTQIYDSADLRDGLSQTWSLCTEVAFYVALPLLALLTLAGRKGSPWRPGRVLALLTLSIPISIAWIILGKNGDYLNPFTSGLWFPAYTMWFAAGMALAVTHVAVSEGRIGRWRTVADIASAPLACWSVAVAAAGRRHHSAGRPAPARRGTHQRRGHREDGPLRRVRHVPAHAGGVPAEGRSGQRAATRHPADRLPRQDLVRHLPLARPGARHHPRDPRHPDLHGELDSSCSL